MIAILILFAAVVLGNPKVAIIGAGPGGTSCAYYLNRYLQGAVNITLFEKNEYVGGRTNTANVHDDPDWSVELGASIFVEANKILMAAAERYNLDFAPDSDISLPGMGELGIWDGEKMVFSIDFTKSAWEIYGRIIARFGISAPWKTNKLSKSFVQTLLTEIYDKKFPFAGLEKPLNETGFLKLLNKTGEQFFADESISGDFVSQFIQSLTRVNYVSNLDDIHGMGALTSFVAEGGQSVAGGNHKIFEKLLEDSKAEVKLGHSVKCIEKVAKPDGSVKWSVSTAPCKKTMFNVLQYLGSVKQEYDYLVIASPFHQSGLETQFGHKIPKTEYRDLHVTLFATNTTLSKQYFKYKDNKPVPLTVLTNPGSNQLFSVSVTSTNTKYNQVVYKIFSFREIDIDSFVVDQLLEPYEDGSKPVVTWSYKKLWQSYPRLVPTQHLIDFEVDTNAFYLNTMESFISTMETSALAGANVAGLIASGKNATQIVVP